MNSSGRFFLFVMIFFCSATEQIFSQTTLSGGNISGILSASGSPYTITGTVTVPAGDTLTVQAGAQLYFDNYSGMNVAGLLFVNGTSSQPVLFTSANTNGFGNFNDTLGGWSGVSFVQSSTTDTSVIEHAIFEYSKSVGIDWTGAALNLDHRSNVIIDSSEFMNNVSHSDGCAIFCTSSSPWINACNFHDNVSKQNQVFVTGGTLGIYNTSSPRVQYCIFQNNTAPFGGAIYMEYLCRPFIGWCDINNNFAEIGQGGGIDIYWSSPVIYHNRIHHNTAYNGGGGIAIRITSNPDIDGNLICDNYAETCGCGATDGGGGIRVDGGSSMNAPCNPVIRNNVVSNNHTLDNGGGIKLYFTNAQIYNNDVAFNFANVKGGGLWIWGSGSVNFNATVKNNIFSGNVSNTFWNGEQVEDDQAASLLMQYNIVDNGVAGVVLNPNTVNSTVDTTNFAANPLWLSPPAGNGPTYDATTANWLIPLNSPAHNAGDPDTTNCYVGTYDYANDQRFAENRIDIGACEIYSAMTGIDQSNRDIQNLSVWPNPSISEAWISPGMETGKNFRITIFSLDGKSINPIYQITGETIRIDLSGISAGEYILVAENGKERKTGRLTITGE